MNKKKILLIEDTPATIDIIREILSNANYNVFISTNGELAISKAEINLPDLILLDILMPGIDGFETCKRLKSNNNTKDIPIVFISALAKSFDKVKAFQLGAVDYVTKPINNEELLARVNAHIELRKARQRIEENERTLKKIIKNQGEGFGLLDTEEKFTFANLAADEIFGVPKNTLAGKNLKEFLDAKQFIKIKQQSKIQKTGKHTSYEITITRPDKQKRQLLITATPEYDNSKTYIGAIAVFRDITFQKKAEAALKNMNITLEQKVEERTKLLRESEKKFRNLFNENPVSLWEEDISEVVKFLDTKKKDGIIDFSAYFDNNPEIVSECASKIKVLNINQASLNIYKAPSKEYLIKNLAKTFNEKSIELFKTNLVAITKGKYSFQKETELLNCKGEVFAAIVQSSIIEDSNKLLVSITDIDKLKKAENALKKSENTLRTIVLETSNKSDQEYFDVLTKVLSKTLGADYVLVGVPTGNDTRKVRTISVCDKNNILDDFEFEPKGAPYTNVTDKNLFVYKNNLTKIFPDNGLFKQIKIRGYIEVPLFSTNKVVNGILVCLYQNPIKDANFDKTILQIFANRTSIELERLHIIDSLRQKNIELTLSEEKLKLANKELTKLSRVLKEKNVELTKNEQQLKEAESIAKMGYWHIDLAEDKLIWSDEIYRIFELMPQEYEANYETYLKAIHPDDRKMVNKAYQDSVKNKKGYNIQHRLLLKDKVIKYVNEKGRTEYDNTGNPLFSIGTIQDITRQKKIEIEMIKLNTAVEQSANVVLITNYQGVIEYVNKKFIEVTGYSKKEAIGKIPNILKSKKLYNKLWATIKSGEKWSGEFQNQKKNGEQYWESTTISPIFNDKGEITNFIAIKEDITEKKLIEQKISNATIKAEEEERGRLAKDLHDGLGPLLSAAKLYIESLKYSDSKKLTAETLIKFNEIIDEAIQSAKEIANNLSPHILKNFGLTAAIKTFTNKLLTKENMAINIRSKLDIRMNEIIEIALYRIVTELINNTLKHAKASIIEIDINNDNNNVLINYADNGIGFIVKKAMTRPSGLGFNNILNRIEILNGELDINSIQNKGSTFKIKVPLKL